MHTIASREDLRRFEYYCPNLTSIDFTMVKDKIDRVGLPGKGVHPSFHKRSYYNPVSFGSDSEDAYHLKTELLKVECDTERAWEEKLKSSHGFYWVELLDECPRLLKNMKPIQLCYEGHSDVLKKKTHYPDGTAFDQFSMLITSMENLESLEPHDLAPRSGRSSFDWDSHKSFRELRKTLIKHTKNLTAVKLVHMHETLRNIPAFLDGLEKALPQLQIVAISAHSDLAACGRSRPFRVALPPSHSGQGKGNIATKQPTTYSPIEYVRALKVAVDKGWFAIESFDTGDD